MPKNRFSFKYRIWKLVISQPFDETSLPLYAQKQVLLQVPHLETGHIAAVRLLHHDDDRSQHHHSYDEGESRFICCCLII